MDYEKKYRNALGWMRSVYPTLKGMAKEDAEHFFPELTESDDKRIWEAIVREFERASNSYLIETYGLSKDKFLAYLEKQKEEEGYEAIPVKSTLEYKLGFTDGRDFEKQKEPHYTKRNALFDKCVENCDPEVMKDVSDQVDEMLGKEQKPDDKCKGCNNVKGCINCVDGSEWAHIEEKEQKPAEWSEEDDQLIGFIFDLLNSLVWRKEWAMDKKECLERLKSLRPSWKPSEWQMSMLLAVINDPNNAGSESCYLTLKSIYEQLKKL